MNLLLDTHVFIWFIEGNASISKKALSLIEDKGNKTFVSIISLYEMVIKQKIGKLFLSHSVQDFFKYADSQKITITRFLRATWWNITMYHCLQSTKTLLIDL
jgi:PIN domain nuclease of toxin-antitoxin system